MVSGARNQTKMSSTFRPVTLGFVAIIHVSGAAATMSRCASVQEHFLWLESRRPARAKCVHDRSVGSTTTCVLWSRFRLRQVIASQIITVHFGIFLKSRYTRPVRSIRKSRRGQSRRLRVACGLPTSPVGTRPFRRR